MKINRFFHDGIKGKDVTKYLPGMEPISFQDMIYYAETNEKFAYKDLQILEFNIEFLANQYIIWNSFHIKPSYQNFNKK